jgi:hypothetical protein
MKRLLIITMFTGVMAVILFGASANAAGARFSTSLVWGRIAPPLKLSRLGWTEAHLCSANTLWSNNVHP